MKFLQYNKGSCIQKIHGSSKTTT